MIETGFLDLGLGEVLFGLSGIMVGGFLRGFLGFGAALLIVPVLSIILTPVQAIVILMIIELPNVVYLMPSGLREFDFKSISVMILGMLIAVPVGAYALVSFDPKMMKLVISVIVLALVALLASGWKFKGQVSRRVMLATGIVGGLIHGSAGMGGPPFVTVLLSRGDDAQRTRANILMTLNCMSVMSAATLFAYGTFTASLIIASCLSAPFYIAFTAIGSRYFRKAGNEYFRKAALIILALIALMVIYSNA